MMRIRKTLLSLILLAGLCSQVIAQEHLPEKGPLEPKLINRDKASLGNILLPQTSAEWVVDIGSALLVTTFLLADQQVHVIPWHQDKWNSKNGAYLSKYDKVEHFGGAAFFHSHLIGLDHAGVIRSTPFRRIKLSLMLITWWEVKDSVISSERYGTWGGEGFSMKDWLAGAGGILGTELLNFTLKKVF